MIELLLAVIILILLFQTHAKEKNVGKYGRLCVFLEKRALGYLIRRGTENYHKVFDFIIHRPTKYCECKTIHLCKKALSKVKMGQNDSKV